MLETGRVPSITRLCSPGQVLCGPHDLYATPRVQHEQVVVAADDGFCSSFQGKLKILVVLRVTTVSHRHRRPDKNAKHSKLAQQVSA